MKNLKLQVQTARQEGKWRRLAIFSLMLVASCGLMALAGCGAMVNDASNAAQTGVALQGVVHGGQNPVSGATIQLYAAQTTANGYGQASNPLILGAPVTSNGSGNFNITGTYGCPASPNDQVYIVATQGNSGGGNNANLVLAAALGPCSGLSSQSFIVINEVTTVATAYALEGFASDYQHVSTSTTNYTGLANAFATVNNLVNVANGQALAVTPAYVTAPTGTTSATFQSVVPQAEIYTLANIIATCVNTNGVGGSSSNCSNLFAAAKPSGGTAPTDTFKAALDIAQNPGNNVTPLYNLPTGQVPFGTTLASPPSDWTIALNFVGGGLGGSGASSDSTSSDLAIDGSGNIWVSNSRANTVTELNNLGAPISSSTVITPSVVRGGFSGGGLSSPTSIAMDTNGNAWVANLNASISEFNTSGSPVGSGFTGGGLSGTSKGLAIDGGNNIWVASYGNSAIAEFNSSGSPLSGTGYTSDINKPTGSIAIDGSGNVWVANGGNGYVVKLQGAGGTTPGNLIVDSGNILDAATAYGAIDSSGRFWVPQSSPDPDLEVFAASTAVNSATYNSSPASIGNSNPSSISIDGAGHVFAVNAAASIPANVTVMTTSGSALSPGATGYVGTGTNLIATPEGSELDSSGNLWLVNGVNSSSVTEFVGIGAPTITPLALAVKNNAIGQLP
jgi:hypothetical protein